MAITFGAVPHRDDEKTRVLLADFCDALSRRAGIEITPHRAPSPKALASAFHRGRIDVAWTSPTLFVGAPAFQDAVPLAVAVRHGQARYSGTLFVPKDSPLRSVADLQGTRVAWVAPTSAGGYLMPRVALRQAGVELDGFFGEETFADTHGEVVRRVVAGEADVGACHAVVREGGPGIEVLQAGFDPEASRVLLVSKPIPSDLIVVRPRVPELARSRLAAALLGADADVAKLCGALFDAQEYRPFDDAPFEALRHDLEQVMPLPWSQSA